MAEETDQTNMAPSARPSKTGPDMEEDECYYGTHGADRKVHIPTGHTWQRRTSVMLFYARIVVLNTTPIDFQSKLQKATSNHFTHSLSTQPAFAQLLSLNEL